MWIWYLLIYNLIIVHLALMRSSLDKNDRQMTVCFCLFGFCFVKLRPVSSGVAVFLGSITLSLTLIKYGCHVNCALTSVIFPFFDFLHSKAPLFLKETVIDHFLCVKQFYQPLILPLWYLDRWKEVMCPAAVCVRAHVCVSGCVRYMKLMNIEQMALKW